MLRGRKLQKRVQDADKRVGEGGGGWEGWWRVGGCFQPRLCELTVTGTLLNGPFTMHIITNCDFDIELNTRR